MTNLTWGFYDDIATTATDNSYRYQQMQQMQQYSYQAMWPTIEEQPKKVKTFDKKLLLLLEDF